MISNKFNHKFKLAAFLLIISSTVFSQGNLPYADGRFIHFGFSLGINAMDFSISPTSNDSVRASTLMPGFSVGAIGDMRLNRYMNLRLTPTLHFGERVLNYDLSTGDEKTNINSVIVSIPAYLKFSAERKDNYRPYLIWGAGVYYDMGTDKERPILLKPLDVFTEFGVGCDIYFSFFKLSPELKFAIGFNDVLTPLDERTTEVRLDDQKFTNSLSKLTTKMVTLTFNFE